MRWWERFDLIKQSDFTLDELAYKIDIWLWNDSFPLSLEPQKPQKSCFPSEVFVELILKFAVPI